MRRKSILKTFILTLVFLTGVPFSASTQKEQKAGEKDKSETAKEQTREKTSFSFQKDRIFFTEPYNYLKPPVKDRIGMALDLDYTEIRFPYGFVNTVSPDTPPIKYKKRIPVEKEKALERIKERSGFENGDRLTVVSYSGHSYPARVTGFSYVGNSPSTMIVAADLELQAENPDQSVFRSPGLAIRGDRDIKMGPLSAEPPLEPDEPLARKLVNLCAGDLPHDYVIKDKTVRPADLKKGESPYYFVSFWQRPPEDYELEDIELKACMFHSSEGVWRKMVLPLPLELIQVYDLDGNGKAELFAGTGDASAMCLAYLVPEGKGYRVLRQGLCSGY